MFGIVTGNTTYDNESIFVKDKLNLGDLLLTYGLRRNVSWGPIVKRDYFPVSVSRSLRANQTVFNIDDHWQALHHLIYPIFTRSNNVYLSFRVEQNRDIPNFSISLFLLFLTKIEAFTKFLTENWDEVTFQKFLLDLYSKDQLTLTTQAQFMSPGDIWAVLSASNSESTISIVVLVYGMLFGNRLLGMDGAIDLKTRQKFIEFFLSEWERKGGERIKHDLGLNTPSYDTAKLDTKSLNQIEKK